MTFSYPSDIIDQYKIKSGSNFPLNLSNPHFNLCLKEIAKLADIDIPLNNKKARKTLATIWYFNRK